VNDATSTAGDAAPTDTASNLGVSCGNTRCQLGQLCVEQGACGCQATVDGGCPIGSRASDPHCVSLTDGGAACFYETFSGPRCADTCDCANSPSGCRCTGADGGVQVVHGCF
jgi:UDP-N-acetylglucosamine enolpyruvyl transferase